MVTFICQAELSYNSVRKCLDVLLNGLRFYKSFSSSIQSWIDNQNQQSTTRTQQPTHGNQQPCNKKANHTNTTINNLRLQPTHGKQQPPMKNSDGYRQSTMESGNNSTSHNRQKKYNRPALNAIFLWSNFERIVADCADCLAKGLAMMCYFCVRTVYCTVLYNVTNCNDLQSTCKLHIQ